VIPGLHLARRASGDVSPRAYDHSLPNPTFAFALFLSSYSPALLILAVRSYHHSTALFWISLGLAVLSAGAFLLFIFVVRRGGPFRATVEDVEPQDGELAAYVATYLLPFIVVFGATLQDVIALALFLFFIGLLWVKSGMIYLNPLLAAIGYHVYVARITPIGAPRPAPYHGPFFSAASATCARASRSGRTRSAAAS
jgi:hypothetical protein